MAKQGSLFTYQVPANTFADIDLGDSRTLSATLGNGDALPGWLNFDATTGTFSGTPANGDVGSLSVKVTASDGAGATVSDTFGITVANVNDAPVVAHHEADQTATQGAFFSYQVPGNTFADIDAGDSRTLTATLANGAALPTWLSFNPMTGILSGTPANADVGTLSIKVTATDGAGASVSDAFGLTVKNVNDAPVVAHAAPDQTATQNALFTYQLPANTFADIDVGDSLTLSATLASGNPLPTWLSFNASTGTFSGTPGNADVGSLSVKVTAKDGSGASVSDVFGLTVQNVNDAPVLAKPIADQNGTAGSAFSLTVPADTFKDVDVGDKLKLSAKLANGDPLPSWLSFNSTTGTFSGTAGAAGQWNVQVVATDLSGASVTDTFSVTMAPAPVNSGPTGKVITGTDRNDRLNGSSGNDQISGGRGNDRLYGRDGDDVLLGGSGRDQLDGGTGNDYLYGGSGRDSLQGGTGIDLLQGGTNNDVLRDSSGNGLMDGGSGADEIHDGSNNSMIVGGKGNDKIYLGGGYDVIAFNRGDGKDSVYSGNGGSTVLSLGGGIRYQDLSLSRSGSNLILNLGNGDSITFEKWYSGRRYQSVTQLQMVVQASADYNPNGTDALRDDKVETFDFNGLVKAFDSAQSRNHGISKWAVNNALAQFHLGGSDTAALGGDVAYQYGMNGTLAGMGAGAARSAVGDTQFGKQAQTLHSETVVKDGVVKLA
jgi:Ca2+-binding RTX toxin-like protein